MGRRRMGEPGDGELVIGSHKLKDWKGPLPLRTHKLLAEYTTWYNAKRGLAGDEKVTEGDVVASVIQATIGTHDEFMRHFEQSGANGAGDRAEGGKAGAR